MAEFSSDLQSYLLYLLVLTSCFQRYRSETDCEAGPCGLGQYYNPGTSVQASDYDSTTNHTYCLPCPDSTYMNLDNHSCFPCRACSQADGSLFQELEHPCTPSSDAVIACQQGYTRSKDNELCLPSIPGNDVTNISFPSPRDDVAELDTISGRPIGSISTDNLTSADSELKVLGGNIKNTSEMLDTLQVQIKQVTPALSDQSNTNITDTLAKNISFSNAETNGLVSNSSMTTPGAPAEVNDDNFMSKKPEEENTTGAIPRDVTSEKDVVMITSNLSSNNTNKSRISNLTDTVNVDLNDTKLVTLDPNKNKTDLTSEKTFRSVPNESYGENVKTNFETNTISARQMFNVTNDTQNFTTVLSVREVVNPTEETHIESHPSQENLSEELTNSSEVSSRAQNIYHTPEDVGRLKSPPVTDLSNASVENPPNQFLNQTAKGISTTLSVATVNNSASKGDYDTMNETGGGNYSFNRHTVEDTGANQSSWEEQNLPTLPFEKNVTSLKKAQMQKDVGEIHSSSDKNKTLNISNFDISYEDRPGTSTVSNTQGYRSITDTDNTTLTHSNTDHDNGTGTYNSTGKDNSNGQDNSTGQDNSAGKDNSTGKHNFRDTMNNIVEGEKTPTSVLYMASTSDHVNTPGNSTAGSSGDRSASKPCYNSVAGSHACGHGREAKDDKGTRGQNNGDSRIQSSGPERNQFVHGASPHKAGFIIMLVILNLMLAIGLFICIIFTVRFRKSLKLAFCPNKDKTKNSPEPIEETEMPLILSKA